jgi:hypothetical protein
MLKVQLDQGETRSVQNGRGVGQGGCLLLVLFNLFNLYCKYLTKEALEGFGDGEKEDK